VGEIRHFSRFLEVLKTKNPVDIRDFHIYGGLIMAGSGLWLYSPALSLAITGFIMLFLGLVAGRIRK